MVHRYIFFLKDNIITTYTKDELIKYCGEDGFVLEKDGDIKKFWEWWANTISFSYEDNEKTDFIFLGKDLKQLKKLEEENLFKEYEYLDGELSFEEINFILLREIEEKVCIKNGKNNLYLRKKSGKLEKIPENLEIENLYILGNSIKENFFKPKIKEMIVKIEKENTDKFDLRSLYAKELKTYKREK